MHSGGVDYVSGMSNERCSAQVLMRVQPGEVPTKKDLQFAADLAAYYSKVWFHLHIVKHYKDPYCVCLYIMDKVTIHERSMSYTKVALLYAMNHKRVG